MSYANFVAPMVFLFALACGSGGLGDDLSPSSDDERADVIQGSTGSEVGQMAPTFSKPTTNDTTTTLEELLENHSALVMYFTMWCPVCDAHSSHLRSAIKTQVDDVEIVLVDFVSGEIPASRSSQVSSGYSDFTTLVDTDGTLQDDYRGNMGSVIVISGNGQVRMNEFYKDGSRLIDVLSDIGNGF
jgi:peroxiredoxin